MDISDIVSADEALAGFPCPETCTLPPGHQVDFIDDEGGPCRIHGGPDFGPLFTAGLYEFSHSPGIYVRRLALTDDAHVIPLPKETSPAFLRDQAALAIAAADWLEGH
jgi:hypothetical protein